MTLLAVTGTNGKTTTTYLLESMLAAAGRRPGVFGTVTYRYAGKARAGAADHARAPCSCRRCSPRCRRPARTDVAMEATSTRSSRDGWPAAASAWRR